jgi:hypothetical protein
VAPGEGPDGATLPGRRDSNVQWTDGYGPWSADDSHKMDVDTPRVCVYIHNSAAGVFTLLGAHCGQRGLVGFYD